MLDTHAHIDDPQYQDNLESFIAQQQAEGVEAILVPGVDVTTIQPVLDVCQRFPNYLFPAIGLHPENVQADYKDQLENIHYSLTNNHYIAIGEIGLDYHFDTTYKTEQQDAFRTRGVMHCYSGSNETAKQIIQLGLYLGIGGVITFKNCKLRDNLTDIPLERLVLETDAPYMAPVPFRGQRNESRWMRYVADVLAQVYQTNFEHIDAVTTANAKALFRLK